MRKSCRSREALRDAYVVVKFGFETAENEPSKVCYKGITPYTDATRVPGFLIRSPGEEFVILCYSLRNFSLIQPSARPWSNQKRFLSAVKHAFSAWWAQILNATRKSTGHQIALQVDGHRQQPYQLSRVDETIDPDFVRPICDLQSSSV